MNAKALRNYWWLAIPLLLGLVTASWMHSSQQPASATMSIGGEFQLDAHQGPVALSDFRGQGVILFFGYTNCPDVCPSGLANVAAALNRLSDSEQAQLQPLFISVDPQRDHVEHLAKYATYFHPRMLGLTGTAEQVDRVVKAYGAFYRKIELPDSSLDYAVDHSTRLYLINADGNVVDTRLHNTPISQLTDDLRKLASGG